MLVERGKVYQTYHVTDEGLGVVSVEVYDDKAVLIVCRENGATEECVRITEKKQALIFKLYALAESVYRGYKREVEGGEDDRS